VPVTVGVGDYTGTCSANFLGTEPEPRSTNLPLPASVVLLVLVVGCRGGAVIATSTSSRHLTLRVCVCSTTGMCVHCVQCSTDCQCTVGLPSQLELKLINLNFKLNNQATTSSTASGSKLELQVAFATQPQAATAAGKKLRLRLARVRLALSEPAALAP
jgi:hypothetical protein